MLNCGMGMDILLLSGGVSVGDYDIVHETLQLAGVEEVFWRVKVKPGKPLFFGKKGNTLIFGLPGNPVSSVVNFNLFVRPVLDKLSGKNVWGLRTGNARILSNRILKPGRRTFLRGKIREANASLGVEIIAEQRSGVFSPMMDADVLLEIPEDMKILKEGDVVKVYYL
jgi:molybdopterin molybdotransferase